MSTKSLAAELSAAKLSASKWITQTDCPIGVFVHTICARSATTIAHTQTPYRDHMMSVSPIIKCAFNVQDSPRMALPITVYPVGRCSKLIQSFCFL